MVRLISLGLGWFSGASQFVLHLLHLALQKRRVWLKNPRVHNLGTLHKAGIVGLLHCVPRISFQSTYAELRECKPENENCLKQEVEREPVEQGVRKVFAHLYEAKDRPVGQPLLPMAGARRFDSLKLSNTRRKKHVSNRVSRIQKNLLPTRKLELSIWI